MDAVIRRRKKLIEMAKQLGGGRCSLCGYDRCMRALEFHHLDASTKSFGISVEGSTRAWHRVVEEIRKCVLLCANCHREVEDGMTKIPEIFYSEVAQPVERSAVNGVVGGSIPSLGAIF